MSSPNILFVFSDQHRWCDLGCYGNSQVRTPNFDRFAAEGLRFRRCVSNAPLCVPARGNLLTGCHALGHGAITNDLPINTEADSVARALRREDYATAYFGKWHLGGIPRDQSIQADRRLGFAGWAVNNCDHAYLDSYYDDAENQRHSIDGYDVETYTNLAVNFVRRGAESEKPWAAWLSWGPPHNPYLDVPQWALDAYASVEPQLRPNVPERIVDRIAEGHYWDQSGTRKYLRGYFAHITALDAQFGRLLTALEETGQSENTIIVYTSDHGDQLGSQGFTNKQMPFEESIRVPLLIRGPEIASGAVSDALVGQTDLPVSLLAHIGAELPEADGADLSPAFRDASHRGLDACYIYDLVACHQSAWRGTEAWRGVRTEDHTYACYEDGTPWLLFDNGADPFQLNNLVDTMEHAELRKRLHERTQRFASTFDGLVPWDELLRRHGLVEAWNESQRHFGLPELPST